MQKSKNHIYTYLIKINNIMYFHHNFSLLYNIYETLKRKKMKKLIFENNYLNCLKFKIKQTFYFYQINNDIT